MEDRGFSVKIRLTVPSPLLIIHQKADAV